MTKDFLKAGHTPTLFAAFFYFDISFMVWVVLVPLGVQIAQDLGLTSAQKGLMVATPILAGALLRMVNDVGTIALEPRPWAPGDLSGAAIAILAARDDAEAASFAAVARAAGVPVNVIDRPAFCDFQFGALVNRSPVVVGISTDGAAPILAQAIRRRIETLLPAGLAAWAARPGSCAIGSRQSCLRPTFDVPSGKVSSTSPSPCAQAERPGCGSRSC